MLEIIPAILEQEFAEVARKIKRVEQEASEIECVQLDIMDGHFVSNVSWSRAGDLSKLTTRLYFEVHLMIEHPYDTLGSWLAHDQVRRVLVHREALDDEALVKFLVAVKEKRREVGVVLNPQTSLETIRNHLILLDEVMFMGVEPGFSGQPFKIDVLNKIRVLKQMHPQLVIAVDGGVNVSTAPHLVSAGATRLCVASFLWQSMDIGEAVRTLMAAKRA